jgi:hypothetical protein
MARTPSRVRFRDWSPGSEFPGGRSGNFRAGSIDTRRVLSVDESEVNTREERSRAREGWLLATGRFDRSGRWPYNLYFRF